MSLTPSSYKSREASPPAAPHSCAYALHWVHLCSFPPPLCSVQILEPQTPKQRIFLRVCRSSVMLAGQSPKGTHLGNSLAIQWLGLCGLTAEGPGSIPGRGTKISHKLHGQKKCTNLIMTNGIVSTEHMCGPCTGMNSIVEYLNFTMTYFKHTKSTEKEHSKYPPEGQKRLPIWWRPLLYPLQLCTPRHTVHPLVSFKL